MTETTGRPVLHGYFRSTAAYRVRIALNLKRVAWHDVFHHLRHGEQRDADYLRLNPQGLVPALEWEGAVLTQSLAICEFIDEVVPEPPLLPDAAVARATVRAFAQAIACDIHPVQNLRVLQRLRAAGLEETAVTAWAHDTIADGLAACDALLSGRDGPYCFGERVTLADLCLVPQLVNARRFGVALRWPRLLAVEAACLALPAFAGATPERQPDAE